jgi:hypothetical protein
VTIMTNCSRSSRAGSTPMPSSENFGGEKRSTSLPSSAGVPVGVTAI